MTTTRPPTTAHAMCSVCDQVFELNSQFTSVLPMHNNPAGRDCRGSRIDLTRDDVLMLDPNCPDLSARFRGTDPTIARVGPDEYDDERDYGIAMLRGRASMRRIPRRYRDAVATHPQVRAWVAGLVERARDARGEDGFVRRLPPGPSLLLLGPTGTGKTHAAYGAVRALCSSGIGVSWRFTTAADLYAALRPRPNANSEEEFDSLARIELLVIDDLGAAKGTEWNEEINYRLVNHRYEDERPTLITSNVAPARLGEVLGERVASRLIEMCDRVTLKGADRRITGQAS